MDRRELLYAVLPLVVLVALAWGSWLVLRQRGAGRAAHDTRRPWWLNPWPWIGVSAVSVVLGLFVWPGLFGGIVVFVPFLWVSRRRREEMDPKTNGHSRRDGAPGGG